MDFESCVPVKLIQSYEETKNDEEVFEKIRELEEHRKKRDMTHAISKNEEFDDISTPAISYLFIPYTAASLYGKLRENRLKALEFSQKLYIQYLEECVRLRFIPKQILTDLINNKQLSAGDERQMKIQRFQESKRIKEKIMNLEKKRQQQRDDYDEEDERDYWKNLIRSCILETLENYNYQKREFDMLTEIFKLKENGEYEERKRKEDEEAEKRRQEFKTFTIPKPNEQISQNEQTMNQYYQSIVQNYSNEPKRLEIQKNVFNPRYKPGRFMTDEDWEAEKEEEMMKDVGDKERTSADDDSNDDEETLRQQREWDEFKDEHRRGSGNTINMG